MWQSISSIIMMNTDRIELFDSHFSGLAFAFEVNPSSCGNSEHYEQYIRFIAIDDRRRGKGVTYAFIRNNGIADKMLGYITLRATSYIQQIEGKVLGNPAIEIFELAVSKDVERQHIGTELIKFAIIKANELKMSALGVEYITLCSDAQAVPFYEKMGFGRLDDQGQIPRESWNVSCIPMLLKLPEG